jgi:anaerobic selenocysteine-containing dehydrogenase
MFLTSRGITNETYYAAGKAARSMGIANVDSAARICHAPSTTALKATIGVAATTCSLSDVMKTDLLVIWGANPANNQPVFMKYLYKARMSGTRVVVINPFLEPGLEHYWVPSTAESALFGTKMCDLHVPVRPGGDVAKLRDRGPHDPAIEPEHESARQQRDGRPCPANGTRSAGYR